MDISELRRIAEQERVRQKPVRINCCTASGCTSSGSGAVKQKLDAAVQAGHHDETIEVGSVGCMGFCGRGPLVMVEAPEHRQLYADMTPEGATSLVESIAIDSTTPAPSLERMDLDHPFFRYQMMIVRENCGKINPERIEEYIAAGGYEALAKVILDLSPEEVIAEVSKSGLRGRGGGGYPTGLKWATVAKMPAGQKYVVCNADEGDPGAFMDRSILESDPHRVLEGMAIAAYAVGANHGYIYIRAEYPLAIDHLETAIKQAKRYGLMGSQILGSPFDFKVDIRVGAGAFVCGEETGLIASIEGKRGTPRPRPPYPAVSGLHSAPTLINNVETYGNIAPILQKGGEWYASIGTEDSKGTKIFALTGKVENAGLIEVPMGITVRCIVEEMGGGVPDGGSVKAVQTGGPSGGCIPTEKLDTPVSYKSLLELGTMMGSGGMIVMDDKTSMVDVAKFYMEFCREESCGKCIPCRAGTVQLHGLLNKLLDGHGVAKDLELMEKLCYMVKDTSLCGLGQSAPNPVISTLRYFREEYEALIRD